MIGNVNVPGALAADIANKVDKIVGKGLSSNDFTDAYKLQLDNLNNSQNDNDKLSLLLTSKESKPIFYSAYNPRYQYIPRRASGSTYDPSINSYYYSGFGSKSNGSDVIYANSKYWYISHQRIYYSNNLKDWDYYNLPFMIYALYKFEYINNRFFIYVNNNIYQGSQSQINGINAPQNYVIYTSINGLDWIKCKGVPSAYNDTVIYYGEDEYDYNVGTNLSVTGVSNKFLFFYGNKYHLFCYIKSNVYVYESSDGINFTLEASNILQSSIAANSYRYYEGSPNNEMISSKNTEIYLSSIYDVLYFNNKIYMINYYGGYLFLSRLDENYNQFIITGTNTYPVDTNSGDNSVRFSYIFTIENNELYFLTIRRMEYYYSASGSIHGLIIKSDNSIVNYSKRNTNGSVYPQYIWYDNISNNLKILFKFVTGSNNSYYTKYVIKQISPSSNYALSDYNSNFTSLPNYNLAYKYLKYNNQDYIISTGYNDIKLYQIDYLNDTILLCENFNIRDKFDALVDMNNSANSCFYKNAEVTISCEKPENCSINIFKITSSAFDDYYLPNDVTFENFIQNPLCVSTNSNDELIIIFESSSNYYYGLYAYIYKFDIVDQKVILKNFYLKPILFNQTDNTVTNDKYESVVGVIKNQNNFLVVCQDGSIYILDQNATLLNSYKFEGFKGIDKLYSWNNFFIMHLENNILLKSKDGINWSYIDDITNNIDDTFYDIKISNNKMYLYNSWNTLYTFELNDNNE